MSVTEVIHKYESKMENLLHILHDIQNNTKGNYLQDKDLSEVANYLHIPLSRVNTVVEFYSMFSKKPRGKYIIRLCQSPPCYIEGAFNMLDELKTLLKINLNETTNDNLFTLETTSCLGACSEAPVMSINNQLYGSLNSDKIRKIIEEYRNNELHN